MTKHKPENQPRPDIGSLDGWEPRHAIATWLGKYRKLLIESLKREKEGHNLQPSINTKIAYIIKENDKWERYVKNGRTGVLTKIPGGEIRNSSAIRNLNKKEQLDNQRYGVPNR